MKKTKNNRNEHIKVEVYLNDADTLILLSQGLDQFRKHMIVKIAKAFEQNGNIVTVEDLAFFLHCPPEIILEDIDIIQNETGKNLPIIGARRIYAKKET